MTTVHSVDGGTSDSSETRAAYQPRILVLACNWCSYTAADLAGTTRLAMPSCFTVLRVMCSGRVDPVLVLRAFALGADGVLVTGCHPGDCHYTSGNVHARRRIDFLEQVLAQLGLAERLEMQYVSAAEATGFQHVLSSFVERVEELGPSPLEASTQTLPPARREAFRFLLMDIVSRLGVDVPEDSMVPEELLAEGYGSPRYDVDRCIGCGACVAVCPQDNIELVDLDGTRTISHFDAHCVRCSACEQACPVEAIRVQPWFDLAAFLSNARHAAVRLELTRCARCGKSIAPRRHLDHVFQTSPAPHSDEMLCASCRRMEHAARTREHLRPLFTGDST